MELVSFSVRSNSSTDDIAENINRVIKKLDVDMYCANTAMKPSSMEQEEEEYVVEEEIEIPQETLVKRTSQNYSATSGIQLSSYACVLEENTDRPELSFGSNLNRSFSRDFGASSPDMFASCSEGEEKIDSAVHQRKPPNPHFSAPLPIAGSTPKLVHKAKSTNDSNSSQLGRLQPKKKFLTKTREKSLSDSSSSKNGKRDTTQSSNRKFSILGGWKVLEESAQEESRTLQDVFCLQLLVRSVCLRQDPSHIAKRHVPILTLQIQKLKQCQKLLILFAKRNDKLVMPKSGFSFCSPGNICE
ncbi:uncharacterized protein LOC116922021 isoform X2 [Daphnia magna]|uniref:uncharacterized protein LOC116922021 isoform X2 n=1 Tax=Daphnia magna TaxID=35525 RepID=UPI001E1BAADA|nr:uncharacterized protein LOC116922021 isoform X2 [Daphnia magna]